MLNYIGRTASIEMNIMDLDMGRCFTATKEQIFSRKMAKNSVKIGELFKT